MKGSPPLPSSFALTDGFSEVAQLTVRAQHLGGGAPRGSPHSAPGSLQLLPPYGSLCEFLGMSLFL